MLLDSRTKGITSRHRGVRSFCHYLLPDANFIDEAPKWRQFGHFTSFWTNLGMEAQRYAKIPQYDWKQERVFVSILFVFLFPEPPIITGR